MQSNSTFTASSYLFLVIYATCSTALLGIPASMAAFVYQDAWLFPIVGSIMGLPILFMYTVLARWLPNGTIYHLNEAIMGKWGGKVLTALFLTFPLLHFPAIISYGVGFISIFLLPSTPLFIIFLLCFLIIIYGIQTGIEPIARTAALISVFFFIPLVILLGLNVADSDIKMIQPMFQSSFWDSAKAISYFMGNVVCNVIIQLTIFPKFIQHKRNGERALWLGYAIGCFILIAITLLCITVLSPEVTARDLYPALSLAQRIEIGEFLERIEATITILWFISIYFNLLLYLFAILQGLSHLFNLKNGKPLLLPLAMLLLFFSVSMFGSVAEERIFYRLISIPQSIFAGLLLPLLLLTVGIIRRKRKGLPLYPKHKESSTSMSEDNSFSNH